MFYWVAADKAKRNNIKFLIVPTGSDNRKEKEKEIFYAFESQSFFLFSLSFDRPRQPAVALSPTNSQLTAYKSFNFQPHFDIDLAFRGEIYLFEMGS